MASFDPPWAQHRPRLASARSVAIRERFGEPGPIKAVHVVAIRLIDADPTHGCVEAEAVHFNMTRPTVAALGLGIAEAALDFTRDQLRDADFDVDDRRGSRTQSDAVVHFQRLEALHEAAMLTVLRAAWLSDQGQPNNLEASIAKAKGGAAVREITQGCIQILGPLAVSREHLLEKWFRDVLSPTSTKAPARFSAWSSRVRFWSMIATSSVDG
jgi:hypothetical protein